ncbi:probable small intestine urate exporter [Ochotona curzoniae]|uniref:probable small intestine urate exporter n=1 Tax=Ochotona curzoniae TaxID=130825 RepID=UPI001B353273|nr:probable small intestine urate exporter [Ochotona curzoniae]
MALEQLILNAPLRMKLEEKLPVKLPDSSAFLRYFMGSPSSTLISSLILITKERINNLHQVQNTLKQDSPDARFKKHEPATFLRSSSAFLKQQMETKAPPDHSPVMLMDPVPIARQVNASPWAHRTKMCPDADAKTTVQDISNDNNLVLTQEKSSRKGFCSVRYGLALILHICNFSLFTQNSNMSIAITAMVNHTVLQSQPNASVDAQDDWNVPQEEVQAIAPTYDWNPEIQGIILSSLNYGSFAAPIPVGYVAGVLGAKYVVGVGLFITSVLSLFIPLSADAGVAALIVVRVIQGLAQVMVLTGQYSLWVRWAPPLERSRLITTAVSGIALGWFIVLIVGGLICQTIGWPYVFYIFGGIGCVCCLLWFPLAYDDPEHHPFISADEKRYIACSLAHQDSLPGWSLPIKSMIKSLPLWAILVAYICQYWSIQIVAAYTPTYFNSVLQINVRDSGILSSLPCIGGYIGTILGGVLADFFFSRRILTLITIRKLFTAIAVLSSSALLMSLHWVRFSLSATITFLLLYNFFGCLSQSGSIVNFIDIAPRYASFLKGFLQMFVFIDGAIAPTVAGILINQDSELGWRNIFLIASAINIVGLIFYLIFGQAQEEDWAKEETLTHF